MELNHSITRLAGNEKPLPDKLQLKAGDLHCTYEAGMIRYISAGDTELIRCIYSAVRDRNWGTLVPVVIREQISTGEHDFIISYHAIYRDAAIHFEADYFIEGTADNRIVFRMKGQAVNTFQKNRIGFCVLYPLLGIRGKPCTVTSPGGEQTVTAFPELVSPVAPMTDISSLDWENEAAKCRLSFQGDVWEMEDHRNWTDSSFKTFCTPLAIPYPVTISQGSEVEQTVLLEVHPKRGFSQVKSSGVRIRPESTPMRLPLIGVGFEAANGKFTTNEADILRSAGLHHLRHDLKFSDPGWQHQLEAAVGNADSIAARLELAIHFPDQIEKELEGLQSFIHGHSVPACRVWAIHEKTRLTDDRLIGLTCASLRRLFPDALIGGGTDAYFAEFNRNRLNAGSLDFVTFAVSPQVHAFDNDSLVENLEAQCDVLKSAQKLYPGKELQVSPVTLKQRFNVVATGEETPLPDDQLPYPVDGRQMSMFAAGWTLGSIISLTKGGAGLVTYYQAIGWQGIIQGDADPEKPRLFGGRRGDIFPVFHLLRLICQLKNPIVYPCKVSQPLACSALKVNGPDSVLLLAANHTRDILPVTAEDFDPEEYSCWGPCNLEQSYSDAAFMDRLRFIQLTETVVTIDPFSFLLFRKRKEKL